MPSGPGLRNTDLKDKEYLNPSFRQARSVFCCCLTGAVLNTSCLPRSDRAISRFSDQNGQTILLNKPSEISHNQKYNIIQLSNNKYPFSV